MGRPSRIKLRKSPCGHNAMWRHNSQFVVSHRTAHILDRFLDLFRITIQTYRGKVGQSRQEIKSNNPPMTVRFGNLCPRDPAEEYWARSTFTVNFSSSNSNGNSHSLLGRQRTRHFIGSFKYTLHRLCRFSSLTRT